MCCLYVSDRSHMADYETAECGFRPDLVLEVDGIYYYIHFATFSWIQWRATKELWGEYYVFSHNLFIVDDVSLKNIVKVVKYNVEHNKHLDLVSGIDYLIKAGYFDPKTWKKINIKINKR